MTTTTTMTTIDGVRIACRPGTARAVRAAWQAADEGGTIQAHDMVSLTDDPRQHTATSLTDYLRRIGAEIVG